MCQDKDHWGYVIGEVDSYGYGYVDWDGDGYADNNNPGGNPGGNPDNNPGGNPGYGSYGSYGDNGYGENDAYGDTSGYGDIYGDYGDGGYDPYGDVGGSGDITDFGSEEYLIKGFFNKEDFDWLNTTNINPIKRDELGSAYIIKQQYIMGCGAASLANLANIKTGRNYTENDGLYMFYNYYKSLGMDDFNVVKKVQISREEGGGIPYEDIIGCLESNADLLGIDWSKCIDANGNYDPFTAVDNKELAILRTVERGGHVVVLLSYEKYDEQRTLNSEYKDAYCITTIDSADGGIVDKDVMYIDDKNGWHVD